MCKSSIYFFLAIMLHSSTLLAQSDIQGSFVHKLENKFAFNYGRGSSILEIDSNRFYFYSFPMDVVGHIYIRTGTYHFVDSIITMDVDTSFGISLNILHLTYLNINCDSAIRGVYNSINQSIRLHKTAEGYSRITTMSLAADSTKTLPLIEFQNSMNNSLEIELRKYGVSVKWLKECLKQTPMIEIKVCSD